MNSKGLCRNRITRTILVFFLFIFTSMSTSFGADTITVDVSAQHGQTEARTMFQMVNDLRTGAYIDGDQSAVWALAQNGTVDTTTYAGLEELQYDYELEKVAMQRAMDLVLQFDHERPNVVPESGEKSYATLYPDGYSVKGENIAAGYGGNNSTAKQAFDGWCETNRSYSGQGHRRNMLGRGYNRIGIAHVIVQYSGNLTEGTLPHYYSTTVDYWVQEFGYRNDSFGLTQTAANDSSETASIEVLNNNIEHAGIETDSDSFVMSVGESKDYDEAHSVIRLTATWPEGFNMTWSNGDTSIGTYYVTTGGGYSLSVADTSIATVSGNTITAKNAGTTNLTVHSALDSSVTKSVELTVEPVSLAGASVTFGGPYEYNGTAQTPSPTVTLGGKTLVKDIDYSISYNNNTNAGEATATIIGKGNYKDSASGTFTIGQKSVSEASVAFADPGAEFTYNGNVQKPAVSSVTVDGEVLNAGTDYEVSAPNSKNKGSYELTVTGKGNYKGSVTKDYQIKAITLTKAMADVDDSDLVYNGAAQLPSISISAGNLQLTEGSDYTVEGEGGVDAGEYTLTVTGINNCSGTFSVDYEIKRAESPSVVPDNNLVVEYAVSVISNDILSSYPGWEFASEDIGTELEEAVPAYFQITYRGSDAGNYTNTTESVKVIRKSCEHPDLSKVAANAETCTEAGNSEYWQCPDCGRFFDSQDASKEIAENSWIIAPHHTIVHYSEKAYCNREGVAEHWGCSACGTLFTDAEGNNVVSEADLVIAATGEHTAGNAVRENEVDSTCTAVGSYDEVKYCTSCNAELSRVTKTIDKKAHTWGAWQVTKSATCVANGSKKRECSVCGAPETQSIPATGKHTMGAWKVTKSATCTVAGSKQRKCSNCSKTETQSIPATGKHSMSAWKVTKAATCTAAGSQERKCTVCGKTEKKAIAAKGHKWKTTYTVDKKATYAAAGSKSFHCSVCNAKKPNSAVSIPKLTVKAVALSSVPAAKKGFTAKWTKGTNINGYELQYALNSKFTSSKKSVLITKPATVSKKVTKLKAKKKYYVRVRAYKTVSGKKYYSAWSKTKAVTTKK